MRAMILVADLCPTDPAPEQRDVAVQRQHVRLHVRRAADGRVTSGATAGFSQLLVQDATVNYDYLFIVEQGS